MNHLGYIAAAWGITVVAVAATILWLVVDGRLQAKRLAALEAQGVRRRSAP